MSELSKRVLFAVPAAALFLYITWVGGWIFTAIIVAIGLTVIYEFHGISSKAGFRPDPYFPYTIGLWVMLSSTLPHAFAIGIGIFLLFVALQVYRYSETAMQEFVSTAFAGIYAPLGFLMFIKIRATGEPETGFMLALAVLLMVWGNDIFAYFGGKQFGAHPMAPKVSPKKTWEGFLFGIAGSVAGLSAALYLMPYSLPFTLLQALPVALIVSIFGPVGDLAASKLKRAAGVKDASNILPGHGGVFDRFDALILAAPAFYLYIYFLETAGYVAF
ncbi:MAG: phosphatidate cytidylyltransferase [Balneolaceae bacterium]|nr:phosphatidate cytidylyltransferase [Balneolaceae bacterium]